MYKNLFQIVKTPFSFLAFCQMPNFKYSSDPTSPNLPEWPSLSRQRPLQFAQLNSSPKMGAALAPEKLEFSKKKCLEFS